MAYRRVGPAAAVTASPTQTLGTVNLGTSLARIVGFQARNWASSAKAGGGTDALIGVKLVDANGQIVYLDAADRDYKTQNTFVWFAPDDTVTGLTGTVFADNTGAATGATTGNITQLAASPVTVSVVNAGTATDYFEVYLFVEYDRKAP
jgi:hypothetical protein